MRESNVRSSDLQSKILSTDSHLITNRYLVKREQNKVLKITLTNLSHYMNYLWLLLANMKNLTENKAIIKRQACSPHFSVDPYGRIFLYFMGSKTIFTAVDENITLFWLKHVCTMFSYVLGKFSKFRILASLQNNEPLCGLWPH